MARNSRILADRHLRKLIEDIRTENKDAFPKFDTKLAALDTGMKTNNQLTFGRYVMSYTGL